MSIFILLLSALVLALLAGAATVAVTYVTAESELYEPVRDWLRTEATTHSKVDRWYMIHDLPWCMVSVLRRLTAFAANLIECPFCSSWWHGLWVTTVFSLIAGGEFKLTLLAYLPTVGIATLVFKFWHRTKPPATNLSEMFKRSL